MNRIILLALLLTAALTQEICANDGFTLVCQNRDIGPVVGGNFLKHQAYLVNEGIQGKRPGSGLFNISLGKEYTPENCYPLFNLFPCVTVLTKDGKEHVSTKLKISIFEEDVPFEARHKHALGLPGTSTSIVFPDIDPKEVICMTVALYTHQYVYTSYGGCVWITPGLCEPLSQEVAFRPKGEHTIYAQFSWPSTAPYQGDERIDSTIINVKLANKKFTPLNNLQLDTKWKLTLDMHTDVNDGKTDTSWWCFPTRNFNKNIPGSEKYIADVLNFGDEFDAWAGHPVAHSIYEE